jgi:zinc transport system permease protein
MDAILQMLSFPFMQRALLAGSLLALLLAALGVFVTVRRMSFFGDGIAHSSLAGIAVAVLFGLSPLPVALAWATAIALLIRRLERTTRLPFDTLIGIFFTASMAVGVVIMSFDRGYQPELVSFLFGSVLSVNPTDLAVMFGVAAVIAAWLAWSFRALTYMSLSEDAARVAGVPVEAQTRLLYVALALATVLGVRVLGIVMVSALLIVPAASARLLARSFRDYFLISAGLSLVTTVLGLIISYFADLPSGATVILTSAAVFFVVAIVKRPK